MPETTYTGVTVVLTPIFHYHREYEIVKRFLERLTTLSDPDHLGSEAIAYTRANINHVRKAMGSILPDDIERQIQITKDFPIRFAAFGFHDYVEVDYGDWPNGKPDSCMECDGKRDAMVHTL